MRINPKQISDLHWQLGDTFHTTNIGQSTLKVCTPSVDVNTLSFAGKRKYHPDGTNLHVDNTVINSNMNAIASIDVHITK